MIYNSETKTIAAVHAGWRGVENQITLKAIEKITSRNTDLNNVHFWIGPHILQKSFEIDRAVLDLLLKSYLNKNLTDCYFSSNDKFFVNLLEIVKSQISSYFGEVPNLLDLAKDTKTENLFHSFRRDQQNSGRNLSFIALLK